MRIPKLLLQEWKHHTLSVLGALMCFVNVSFGQMTITGTITDAMDNSPLIGVNVLVKGTTTGTVTDLDGRYSLDVSNTDAVLVYSYTGYANQEIVVGEQSVINVPLSPSSELLDEVVVIGYGSQKKSDLTGSVSSVNTEAIEKLAVSRVDDVLQGRSAGVLVSKVNGAPGGDVKIRIRGTNSITGNNQPLVVIDDFIGGDLSTIDMNDVQSIQVLKDASATAIYGSRASNGVVIVTTKKGQSGKPQVGFSSFFSFGQVMRKFDLMSAAQYAESVNEQFRVFGKPDAFSQEEISGFRTNGGTDWQDEVFRTGVTQNYGVNISGGTDDVRYFASAGYQNIDGIVINSFNRRYTGRANLEFDVSPSITAGVNLFIINEEENNVNNQGTGGAGSAFLGVVSYAPTIPVRDETTGDYSEPNPTYGVIQDNPVYRFNERNNRGRNHRTNTTGFVKWQITDWLSIRTSGVFNNRNNNTEVFNRFIPGGGISDSDANHSNSYLNSFQNTNVLNFEKRFGIHNIDASLIYETFDTRTRRNNINATALTSIALDQYSTAFGESLVGASGLSGSQLESYMGRINYGLKDKYLITASVRVDGSSKFSKDNRYGVFPSAAFAWRVSEEDFMKSSELFDNLKFRASWGATGNQGIDPFETLPTLGIGANVPYEGGTTALAVGVAPNRIANPDLKWETTEQANIGIDFGILNNRIYGSIDWYQKKTKDLLLEVQLPNSNGIGTQLKNIGEIENKGVEIELGGIAYHQANFRWDISGNISFNKNKVVSLVDPAVDDEVLFTNNYFGNRIAGDSPNALAEGYPIGMLWGLTYLGPWSVAQTAEAAEFNRVPGDANFEDRDGNKAYDDFGLIGDPNPDFTWGLNNRLSYKAFDLNLLFTGMQGREIWNFIKWQTLSEFGGIRNPTGIEYLDRWTENNQDSQIPGISRTNEFRPQNTFFIEDGSFVKLKDITLGYTLRPSKHISELRLYASGQNLLMLTQYGGYDPEADGQGSARTGAQGGDTGAYPNARAITVGLNVKF